MPNATAGMANKLIQKDTKVLRNDNKIRALAHETVSLDRRYGQIGISAVAAAARYQGGAKNPAYAPSALGFQDRDEDAAA